MPGYALSAADSSGSHEADPAPSGIAYYGESNTTGTTEVTTVDASSLAGSLTVDQLSDVSFDSNTPDVSGVQLNAVLTNVTLQGTTGYEFWTQNTIDYYQENGTVNFGEDTWNFSSLSAEVPAGNSTILNHDPIGAITGGIYLGLGPFLRVPAPFSLTLYLNSSITAGGEQELWYNYSLAASGEPAVSGNYDWLVFNSTNSAHPASVTLAPFEATGTSLDPVGLPNDFELDFGIGSYDGTTVEDLSANLSATLDYCPAATPVCSSAEMQSVPAALDFGSETGETGSGLAFTYSGTTENATAGPFILRGLWGYTAENGSAPGSTSVANYIRVVGAPDPVSTAPYVFVFFALDSYFDSSLEWAPDVPTWNLAPGWYSYGVMLSNYDPVYGILEVGSTPTRLNVALTYNASQGVYTPLWAFSNAQLAGISDSGNGTVGNQYQIFNDPAAPVGWNCSGAYGGVLNGEFFDFNDFLFPAFAGILFEGTSAYVEIDHPVSFCVGYDTWGLLVADLVPQDTVYFYLQIELIDTAQVTLAHDPGAMGWPGMFEIFTLAGLVPASENPFPTANVVVWNSTDDLVMSNEFDPAALVPAPQQACIGECPPIVCDACASPDGLLLYGGTRNTIWGNTFENTTSVADAQSTTYAGLAEAESGDLIYNNNFSVGNPTVYLPFDVYNDSCGYSYAGDCLPNFLPTYSDTWNITNQSASDVARVVNGFSLSGNVLGPACSNQGGNYWNDYGNSLNPFGTLPFTNVYNYSDIASVLPGGEPANEPSIRAGGDYSPLLRNECATGTPYTVSFQVSGLSTGAEWSIAVNGYTDTSTTSWINFSLPNGEYPYSFTIPSEPSFSSNGSFQVEGANLLIPVAAPPTPGDYAVTFTETGLPTGSTWYVNVSGTSPVAVSSVSAILELANASYTYSLASADKEYAPTVPNGSFTVNGTPLSFNVEFVPEEFPATFGAAGLPADTVWYVNVTGAPSTSSTTSSATLELPNGSYAFSIASSNKMYAPSPAGGTFRVTGASVAESIEFALVVYAVEFEETGLASGTNWSVTLTPSGSAILESLSGSAGSLTRWSDGGSTIFFAGTNGTYAYSASASGHSNASGTVSVHGSPTPAVTVAFGSSSSPSLSEGAVLEYVLIGVVAAIVGALLVSVVMRRRRAPPTPSAPTTPPPPADGPAPPPP